MSFGRRAVFLFVAMPAVAAPPARSISCPATSQGHHVTEANLFVGEPSHLASLIPQDGGWFDVQAPPGEPDKYLVCNYGARELTFHLPRNVTKCLLGAGLFDHLSRQPAVVCQ